MGVQVIDVQFGDGGNSLSPGTSVTTSITIPSGTEAILVIVTYSNRGTTAFTACSINGTSLGSTLASAGTAQFNVTAQAWAMTSSLPSGTVDVVVSGRNSSDGATHTHVFFLSGCDLSTANWRAAASSSATTAVTSRVASVTPTAATGLLVGVAASRRSDTNSSITPTGFTAFAGTDVTPSASSNDASHLSTYGSTNNASTSAQDLGGSIAASQRMVACGVWVKAA